MPEGPFCQIRSNLDVCYLAGRYQAGQNLYLGTLLSDYNWTDIVDGWYSEVDHFSYGVGSTTGAAVGHYTQVRTILHILAHLSRRLIGELIV